MAKKRRRKYSRGSGEEVRREMHRYKRGRAKSGRGGKGGKVKSRKQAIAYPADERRSSCARSPGTRSTRIDRQRPAMPRRVRRR